MSQFTQPEGQQPLSSRAEGDFVPDDCPRPKSAALIRFSGMDEFLTKTGAHLVQSEVENGVILGAALYFLAVGRDSSQDYLGAIGRSETEGVFFMTPPARLLLSYPFADQAIEQLIEDLIRNDIRFPGVFGVAEVADKFARAWSEVTALPLGLKIRLVQYETSTPPPLPIGIPGHLRPATEGDLDQLVSWTNTFNREVGQVTNRHEISEALAKGYYSVWDDNGPVSMLRLFGPTLNTIRLKSVYTPPERQGKGYASALVAAATGELLRAGHTSCFLFTDVNNQAANKLYEKVGYRRGHIFHEYR